MPTTEPRSQILAPGTRDPRLRLHLPERTPDDEASELCDPRHYRAFETGLKPARMVIHCAAGPSRSPPYMALLDVAYDRHFGGSLALVFHHMVVTLTGRNLSGLAAAICRHRATIITEFDAQAFDVPAGNATIIERVEFEGGRTVEDVREVKGET